MLKGWTRLEKILLCTSIILVSFTGIIFKSDILIVVCSIIGIITALLLAKGKYLGQVFGIVIAILYSIVSYKNKLYGEVIAYLFVKLPMFLIGTLFWIKYTNKQTSSVQIKKISNKEWIIILLSSVFIFIIFYYLLELFNTKELIISTLSLVDGLCAIYLGVRRSKYSFCFYILNDLLLIVLWGISVFDGDFILIPMLLNPIINLINDSYGIYNWNNLEKLQKNKRRQ